MSTPRLQPFQVGLANTRQARGDGSVGGRLRAATPIANRGKFGALGQGGLPAEGTPTPRFGALLHLSGTVDVTGTPTDILGQLTTVLDQLRWPSWTTTGDPWTVPISGAWHIYLRADPPGAYTAGLDLVVLQDGVPVPEQPHPTRAWSFYDQTASVCRLAVGADLTLTAATRDASTRSVGFEVWVTLMEPTGAEVPDYPSGGVYIHGYDAGVGQSRIWFVPTGTQTATEIALPAGVTNISGTCQTATGAVLVVDADNDAIYRAPTTPTAAGDWVNVHTLTQYGAGSLATDGTRIRGVGGSDGTNGHTVASDDGGLTWTAGTYPLSGNPALTIIGHNAGVWVRHDNISSYYQRSSDGDTWSATTQISGGPSCRGIVANGSTRMLAAFSWNNTNQDASDAYRSTNSGSTWTPVDLGFDDPEDGTNGAFAFGENLFVVGDDGANFDSGSSTYTPRIWRDVGAGLVEMTNGTGIQFEYNLNGSRAGMDAASGRLFAPTIYSDDVLYSDDSGATWQSFTFEVGFDDGSGNKYIAACF